MTTSYSQSLQLLLHSYKAAKQNPGLKAINSKQLRDLTVLDITNSFSLVVAIDSDGGIGPNELDVVNVTGYELGRFAVRVPLMEILACGAVPLAAFNSLTIPMEPHGKEIIKGIRAELCSVGLPEDFPLSGSTEDNIPTKQTGVGIVILGLAETKDIRIGNSQINDEVYCIGIPKSGPFDKISLIDNELADGSAINTIGKLKGVHDILPIGSKGILYESKQLADSANLQFEPIAISTLELKKSAGPSTCFLVSTVANMYKTLSQAVKQPVTLIGFIKGQ